jgi:ribokinase
MNTVAVIGSLNMDLIARVAVLPRIGETVMGQDFSMLPGGKGANQAVAMGRLGLKVHMIGMIGRDIFGKKALQSLRKNGVDFVCVGSDDTASTGIALISVDRKGSNTIVVAQGANAKVSPEFIHKHEGTIKNAKVVIIQLEVPIEAMVEAVNIAHNNNVLVILNAAPARVLPPDLYRKLDVLIVNESEARALGGHSIENEDDLALTAHLFIERGCRHVVFTLGAGGAAYISADEMKLVNCPAYPIDPVDTVGAGDAFVGGFTFAYLKFRSLKQAVKWGNACGALACTQPGAQVSFPTLDEVIDFLDNKDH